MVPNLQKKFRLSSLFHSREIAKHVFFGKQPFLWLPHDELSRIFVFSCGTLSLRNPENLNKIYRADFEIFAFQNFFNVNFFPMLKDTRQRDYQRSLISVWNSSTFKNFRTRVLTLARTYINLRKVFRRIRRFSGPSGHLPICEWT
jgi:hypothetical protein